MERAARLSVTATRAMTDSCGAGYVGVTAHYGNNLNATSWSSDTSTVERPVLEQGRHLKIEEYLRSLLVDDLVGGLRIRGHSEPQLNPVGINRVRGNAKSGPGMIGHEILDHLSCTSSESQHSCWPSSRGHKVLCYPFSRLGNIVGPTEDDEDENCWGRRPSSAVHSKKSPDRNPSHTRAAVSRGFCSLVSITLRS